MELRETVELSTNNVSRLEKILALGENTFLVEYGSGNSTIFWTERLKNKKSGLVSVEYSEMWYKRINDGLQDKYGGALRLSSETENVWSIADYLKYITIRNKTWVQIPKHKTRIEKGRRRVLRGFIKSLLGRGRIRSKHLEYKIGEMVFHYMLSPEFFKDQYGESPNANKYIRAGTIEAEQYFKSNPDAHFIFMIDGGPRAHIALEVIKMEERNPDMKITIMLYDAWRGFYEKVFSERNGVFLKGNNMLASGEKHVSESQSMDEVTKYWVGDSLVDGGMLPRLVDGELPRDVWVYSNTFMQDISRMAGV